MTAPSASIIIPVHNRRQDLIHLLGQLTEQALCDFEVLVVDDGSSPPVSPGDLPANPPYTLRLVRHEVRGGVGMARNTGVTNARADLLVFVDSDGDVSDVRWFEKHMALYRQAAVMARAAGKEEFVFHSEVIGISHTYWGRADTYSNWFGSSMTRPCEVTDRHVPTHNTSVHRRVFDRVGLFSEALEVCEDVEWAFRCLYHGVGLFYIPGAPIGHFDRNGFRAFWEHYYRFGLYSLRVREERESTAYQWLFPRGLVSAVFLFLPLTVLMTGYIVRQWLFKDPRVLLYAPGLYLANAAYYVGICRSFAAK